MITDEDIKEVTEAFISIANKTGILNDVVASYNSDKSLAFKIIGSKFRSGFIVKEGSIRMLSDMDKPTLSITMDKDTYWIIINSESSGLAKARFYTGIYTEETIQFDPPPGSEGGALHMENVIKVICALTEMVIGGSS